ncbi:hypothetical protein HNP84_009842 [Thermocatellispora tengchongensis]|uniref:Uncharacterized protein n=1 Tax=Thermocatellispora tengchongensis TaxID=1073253 RepID=A0A840PSH0_9ACTN|nr:hypothetical protein [Thermocatellispora tengchongensis]MBB5140077.1 hypothetical protein [Thermocatellispora tengchongensis]
MGPELHYQMIINRVAELHEEAATHRQVREAEKGRKSGERRHRAAFGKLRAS